MGAGRGWCCVCCAQERVIGAQGRVAACVFKGGGRFWPVPDRQLPRLPDLAAEQSRATDPNLVHRVSRRRVRRDRFHTWGFGPSACPRGVLLGRWLMHGDSPGTVRRPRRHISRGRYDLHAERLSAAAWGMLPDRRAMCGDCADALRPARRHVERAPIGVRANGLSDYARRMLHFGRIVPVCHSLGVPGARRDFPGDEYDLRGADLSSACGGSAAGAGWTGGESRPASSADWCVLLAVVAMHRDDGRGLCRAARGVSGGGAGVYDGVLPRRIAAGGVLSCGCVVRGGDGDGLHRPRGHVSRRILRCAHVHRGRGVLRERWVVHAHHAS